MSNPKIIVILGPTASGKTKLAVTLAQKFKGEIISADSRQIYRGLDIGTGKDLNEYERLLPLTKGERKRGYHLINIKNPNQKFNVANFKKLALQKIKEITARGHLPFLVGGTGLYLSALIDNYQIPKVKPDTQIRKKLAAMTLTQKLTLLQKLDPASFKTVDLKNPRRLDRALEVCLSGQKFSASRGVKEPLVNPLIIGLQIPREKLNKKINARVEQMIKKGLVAETKKLIKQYGINSAPLQTIGYVEIIGYLNNKYTPAETFELIKTHTRQYAKRQMTWFQRDKRIHWITKKNEAKKLIKQFVSR
ncbi:MAG TPA: tRNA (adenosine(37)-N6)-dimethylallyltransferase MiaA [Patescibacteria group bacterium]|nr:tRNA (adenosine(37)-N6)-dimethylallyltransferase MiaA [Patescibacteria group bacterium]